MQPLLSLEGKIGHRLKADVFSKLVRMVSIERELDHLFYCATEEEAIELQTFLATSLDALRTTVRLNALPTVQRDDTPFVVRVASPCSVGTI